MAKIVFFMLVIMSLSLYSQQDTYWQKVDFDFGSGVKLIHINQEEKFSLSRIPFLVYTYDNQLFYFKEIDSPGEIIKLPDYITDVDKIRLLSYDSENVIFFQSNNELYLSTNFGIDWVMINNMLQEEIIDFETVFYGNSFKVFTLTKDNVFFSFDSGITWTIMNDGLDTNKLKLLSFNGMNRYESAYLYGLSKDNKIFSNKFDSQDKKWTYEWIWQLENFNIKGFHYLDGNYIYWDSDSLLSVLTKKNITEKICKATCFRIMDYIFLLLIQINYIPITTILIGTAGQGVYAYGLDYGERGLYKLSDELDSLTITDIETNSHLNPLLCLVGTKEDGLYFGELEDPKDVNDKSNNPLQTQIYPQPASDKAKLNFTLPQSSQVSIKLYNTLGIELQTIANTFFSEGLNSIPIDLSNLSDAVYFVVIDYRGERVVEKIVVRK